MFTGVGSYLVLVAVVAVVCHALSRDFLVGGLGGAVLSSVANLAHETYRAGAIVNLGWAPILLVAGFVVAPPLSLLVGWPFVVLHARRRGEV